jgi:hypothetical protein
LGSYARSALKCSLSGHEKLALVPKSRLQLKALHRNGQRQQAIERRPASTRTSCHVASSLLQHPLRKRSEIAPSGEQKKILQILRKFARASHPVRAKSFFTFDYPPGPVGFLYLFSRFCIKTPAPVRRSSCFRLSAYPPPSWSRETITGSTNNLRRTTAVRYAALRLRLRSADRRHHRSGGRCPLPDSKRIRRFCLGALSKLVPRLLVPGEGGC